MLQKLFIFIKNDFLHLQKQILLDTYLTIKSISEGLYKEKGSRFIGYAFPLSSSEEIKAILSDLQKQYHDARHICYAYVTGFGSENYRVNDNGEPSGTAGRPILGAIRSNNLTNVLVVVIRYFGGIKLGTSGLITAYKEAAEDAINNGTIIEKIIERHYEVLFQYLQINEIMRILKELECTILKQEFDINCSIQFKIRKNDAERVEEKIQKTENTKLQFLVEK